MHRHVNEISRSALSYLAKKGHEGARFQEMAEKLDIHEKDLSKNLFWLEEHHMIKLSTSLPAGSTFPQIVIARLTREGEDLVSDPEKLDKRFPVDEPDKSAPVQTYGDVLRLLRDEIEADKNIDGKSRRAALAAMDKLSALAVANKGVRGK